MPSYLGIKTRASVVAMLDTSLIIINLFYIDSIINYIIFTNMLYALNIFILIILYLQIYNKGLYYYS
jgi:hypothetical protein